MWLMSLEERCSRCRWRSDRCDQWYLRPPRCQGAKEPTAAQPHVPACPAPSQPAPVPGAKPPPIPGAKPPRPQGQPAPVPGPARAGVYLVITVTLVGPSPWHCQL